MKYVVRRIMALFLLSSLLLGTLPVHGAQSSLSDQHADSLNTLGMFKGTNNGYELDKVPNRAQGVTMLIRLLGKEDDATKGTWKHPFTDAQDWSYPYVAYAYEKGLTKGGGNNLFGGDNVLGARDYVTFLLRVLGYDDSAGQFTWQDSLTFAQSKGMLTQAGAAQLASKTITRGDMVDLSYAAMFCKMENGRQTLAEKLMKDGVFTKAQGTKSGVLDGKAWAYGQELEPKPESKAVAWSSTTVAGVKVDVIRVDLTDPSVRVEAALANGKLGTSQDFATIAKNSGAAAAVNGNFFNSDSNLMPVGSIISKGEALYTMHGYTVMGIDREGNVTWGRPALTVWVRNSKTTKQHWIARSVNVAPSYHTDGYSVMYTPAYGQSVTANCDGYAIVVEKDTVTDYLFYTKGQALSIPADGYVLLLGTALTKLYAYSAPKVGDKVTTEIYCYNADKDDFDPKDLYTAVTGAPRLLKDGAVCNETDPNFDGAKFTTMSTPRTAVGTTPDGQLVLVSCSSATVEQMKSVMLELGCSNAVNLDGGGSCGMYYNGKVLHTPGRNLTSTLQIFVD